MVNDGCVAIILPCSLIRHVVHPTAVWFALSRSVFVHRGCAGGLRKAWSCLVRWSELCLIGAESAALTVYAPKNEEMLGSNNCVPGAVQKVECRKFSRPCRE